MAITENSTLDAGVEQHMRDFSSTLSAIPGFQWIQKRKNISDNSSEPVVSAAAKRFVRSITTFPVGRTV